MTTRRVVALAAAGLGAVALALAGRAMLERHEPGRFVLPDAEIAATPGMACPAIELPDVRGAMHALCGDRGTITMINFWTTWCAPCVAEFDLLIATLREYEPRGVRFVSVSLDRREAYEDFVTRLPADHVALDASATGENVSSRFGNVGVHVPFDVLIAPDGTIAATRHGSFGDAKAIRAWLDREMSRYR